MPMNYSQNGGPNFIGQPNQMPDPRMGGYPQQSGGQIQQQPFMQNSMYGRPQSPGPATFPGRYISDLLEVTPNEVPMDGQIALFPTKDLSEIYLKSWSGDGRILNFRYILDTSVDLNAPVAPQQEDFTNITARLSALEEQVKKRTSTRGRNKQEEEATNDA